METVNIQLEASYSTINVVYSTRGTSSGVNISSTGVMTWTSNNPSQSITVRLALKNCPQIQYTDVTLTLIIHTCNEICGMNAVCIRNVNTPPGDSNYTCSCRDDSRTYCHPNACPPNGMRSMFLSSIIILYINLLFINHLPLEYSIRLCQVCFPFQFRVRT